MLENIIFEIKDVLSVWFVLLLVVSGFVLVFIFPSIAGSRYPVEYKIGKAIGYLFLFGGPTAYILLMIFS